MADTILAGVYLIWFGISVARQTLQRRLRLIAKWDVLHLVPGWRLFETPSGMDFRFTHRYQRQDGTHSDWQDLSPRTSRSHLAFLWHPDLIEQTVLLELAHTALRVADGDGRRKLRQSARYRAFVAHLASKSADPDHTDVQFMIFGGCRYDAGRPWEVVFLSDWNPI